MKADVKKVLEKAVAEKAAEKAGVVKVVAKEGVKGKYKFPKRRKCYAGIRLERTNRGRSHDWRR